MDTSEQYIEMCRKAEEIQKLKPVINGCWKDWEMYVIPENKVIMAYTDDEWGPSEYYEGEEHWIPRQDQLQEMLEGCFIDYQGDLKIDDPIGMINCFADFAEDWEWNNRYGFSMEKNWIAFVMKEKFNKTWTGTEWI